MIVRLLGLLLVVYATYIGFSLAVVPAIITALWAACFLICGVGLIFHVRWAAYLWYVLALFMSASWIWAVVGVVRAGWPYSDAFSSAISLIPGSSILLICGFGSLAVARHFRQASGASSATG